LKACHERFKEHINLGAWHSTDPSILVNFV